MSVCPECNLPNDIDDLNCEKCKKRYHWLCTHLEKYDIKLHKQNPYKTWRCPTCIDKFCKNCDQIFPDNYQESIECAKCQNWYHFHCSDLTVDEFFSYLPENSDDWLCKKCVEKMCKKCGKNIYKQNKIKCSNCQFCFHSNSCAKIPKNEKNSLSSKSWLCQKCLHIVYPFSGINDEEIFNLSAHKLEKFSIKNLSTDLYSNSCNVCKKSVKADKHVPCTTYIHTYISSWPLTHSGLWALAFAASYDIPDFLILQFFRNVSRDLPISSSAAVTFSNTVR